MRLLALITALLTACSADKREYHPPANTIPAPGNARLAPPRPESGKVLGFSFASSPDGGDVTTGFVGGMLLSPLSSSMLMSSFVANDSHIPTYQIRLESGRTVHVRHDSPVPLLRGSRVMLQPTPEGYRILPDQPRR